MKHTRQDFTAFSWVPVQTSQGTSAGSTQGCSFTRRDVPNRSTISEIRILTGKSGLVLKSSLQTGHLYLTCSSQNLVIQALQKLCPHGVETGLLNTSRQMEHEKLPSDQEVLAEAILDTDNKVYALMIALDCYIFLIPKWKERF